MSEFKSYRCIFDSPINIGGTEPPEAIQPQEIVLYDGRHAVKRTNGDPIKLRNPQGFKAIIKAGWVVPVESTETRFRPRPAGVKIHEATPRGTERAEIIMGTAADEHRSVGDLDAVRQAANTGEVPATHHALDTSKEIAATRRASVVESHDEGRVVGRIKSPAQMKTVQIGKDDQRIVRAVSNPLGESPKAHEAVATGDVKVARSGESLEDLLPNAASTGVPESKFTNDGVVVESTSTSLGGAEGASVVGSIKKTTAEAPKVPRDQIGALREWVEGTVGFTGPQLQIMVKSLLRKYDTAYSQAADIQESAPVPVEVGGSGSVEVDVLEWSTSGHWKTREKVVKKQYAEDAGALRQIIDLDPSGGVKKTAQRLLGELRQAR